MSRTVQSRIVRLESLPQLADTAVRASLRPAYTTVIVCGLVLAMMNGALAALMALVSGDLATTSGSLLLLGSMIVWMPVMLLVSIIVYGILAVHGAMRTTGPGGVDAGLGASIRFFFSPRVLATVVLMLVAIAGASVFLILPGILVAALLSLTIPVMVRERRFLVDGMLRSVGLVWVNPEGRILSSPVVRVIALVLASVALNTLMTMVFQLPMQLITQGMIFREALAGTEASMSTMATVNWISLPFTIAIAIVGTWVYSWLFHALGLFYRDLVERREAPMLAAAVRDLAAVETRAADGAPDAAPGDAPDAGH